MLHSEHEYSTVVTRKEGYIMSAGDLKGMSGSEFPSSWSDPQYVTAIVGVLAVAALYVYSALTQSGPTIGEITFVLLVVLLPTTIAHEIARRL